jgi:branched-chain amino acid transport system ATP-binding protein
MLEVRNIRVSYGAAPAISEVSLLIEEKDLVVVVGPNGAGKTTLINALAGLHPIDSGALRMDGRDISRLSAHRYCDEGIALVPEGRRLFTGLSVRENLEIGSYRSGARALRAQSMSEVLTAFPILKDRMTAIAGTLSGGPSLGLAPAIVLEMFRAIRDINARGVAVLLVEQNVAAALEIARRAYVLEEGRIVAQGEPRELAAQPHIRKAYLGIHP